MEHEQKHKILGFLFYHASKICVLIVRGVYFVCWRCVGKVLYYIFLSPLLLLYHVLVDVLLERFLNNLAFRLAHANDASRAVPLVTGRNDLDPIGSLEELLERRREEQENKIILAVYLAIRHRIICKKSEAQLLAKMLLLMGWGENEYNEDEDGLIEPTTQFLRFMFEPDVTVTVREGDLGIGGGDAGPDDVDIVEMSPATRFIMEQIRHPHGPGGPADAAGQTKEIRIKTRRPGPTPIHFEGNHQQWRALVDQMRRLEEAGRTGQYSNLAEADSIGLALLQLCEPAHFTQVHKSVGTEDFILSSGLGEDDGAMGYEDFDGINGPGGNGSSRSSRWSILRGGRKRRQPGNIMAADRAYRKELSYYDSVPVSFAVLGRRVKMVLISFIALSFTLTAGIWIYLAFLRYLFNDDKPFWGPRYYRFSVFNSTGSGSLLPQLGSSADAISYDSENGFFYHLFNSKGVSFDVMRQNMHATKIVRESTSISQWMNFSLYLISKLNATNVTYDNYPEVEKNGSASPAGMVTSFVHYYLDKSDGAPVIRCVFNENVTNLTQFFSNVSHLNGTAPATKAPNNGPTGGGDKDADDSGDSGERKNTKKRREEPVLLWNCSRAHDHIYMNNAEHRVRPFYNAFFHSSNFPLTGLAFLFFLSAGVAYVMLVAAYIMLGVNYFQYKRNIFDFVQNREVSALLRRKERYEKMHLQDAAVNDGEKSIGLDGDVVAADSGSQASGKGPVTAKVVSLEQFERQLRCIDQQDDLHPEVEQVYGWVLPLLTMPIACVDSLLANTQKEKKRSIVILLSILSPSILFLFPLAVIYASVLTESWDRLARSALLISLSPTQLSLEAVAAIAIFLMGFGPPYFLYLRRAMKFVMNRYR